MNFKFEILHLKFQEGVSLIITFLIMTVMLAVALNLVLILYGQFVIVEHAGDSVNAFYAADTGAEKTLYYDRKQIPSGAVRGLCSICSTCSGADCQQCQAVSLTTDGSNGCDPTVCNDCQVTYNSQLGSQSFSVAAEAVPYAQGSQLTVLFLDIKGAYNSIMRALEISYTQ